MVAEGLFEQIMKKIYEIRLEVEVDVPNDATDDDIESFLQYEMHYNHSISIDNPCYEEGDFEIKDFDMYEL